MIIRSVEDNVNEANVAKGKVVRNMGITKELLSRIDMRPTNILRVIDVKKDRADPTGNSSVLVFEDNEKFQEEFSAITAERRKNRESAETADLKKQIEEMQKKIEELSGKESSKE